MPKVPRVPHSSRGEGNTRQISPAKHWCFTLNNYTSSDIVSLKEKFDNEIVPKFQSSTGWAHKYIFQEETGENGTPHLQGYVAFRNKLRPISVVGDRRIHWEKCKHPVASIRYCCKSDTRTGEIYSKGINLDRFKKFWLDRKDFLPWQASVWEILQVPSDYRTIHWIYESVGNTGKSSISKAIVCELNALILAGKGADMKYGIVSYFEKKGVYPDIIIIDIPRSNLEYVSYCGIEEIKNGCFFSGKYESGMCVFPNPKIVCFANEPPKWHKVSRDRWKCYEIVNFGLKAVTPPSADAPRGWLSTD